MDRPARNLDDLRQLVCTLTDRGVKVEFVKEDLTFTGDDSPMATLAAVHHGILRRIRTRPDPRTSKVGIAAAKKHGVYSGCKKALTDEQAAEIRQRVAGGETKAALAREYEVSRETLYQHLR